MNKQLAGKCREGDSRGSDLKGLGDDVVVEADVVPAMAAAVHPRPHQLRHRRAPPLPCNQSTNSGIKKPTNQEEQKSAISFFFFFF